MKKSMILLITIILTANVFAQTQLPNSGFEDWQEVLNSKSELMYESLSGDFWATLNKLRLLGGPVTVEKTEDTHSGNYAAKLETKGFGTFRITGLIISGYFDSKADPGENMVEGKPFTAMPDKLGAFIKNHPKNGDSSAIYINLTKWNGTSRDTIAEASISFGREISEYELIELNLNYYRRDIEPDTIKVTFLSSVGGRNFTGGEGTQPQIGSTMYIDNCFLEYTSGVQTPLFQVSNARAVLDRQQDYIEIFSENNIEGNNLQIYNAKGEVLLMDLLAYPYIFDVSAYPSGTYYFNIVDNNKIYDHGNFLIIR